MSAIARILLARGEFVAGSDTRDSELIAALRSAGAQITIGHKAENVCAARMLVVSSAIGDDNAECKAARNAGIPILRRGEMLARIMQGRQGIAVSGTHGKTTTTAMVSCILHHAGIDASVVLGGEAIDTGTNARDGSDSWFLTEADESDGSFMQLTPDIAVVTNIENDHIVSDEELPRLVAAFAAFVARVPQEGLIVVGLDNAASASLRSAPYRAAARSFGLDMRADVRATNICVPATGSHFEVVSDGAHLGTIQLKIPGKINIVNALAAITVAQRLKIPFSLIAQALGKFSGVRRRFDVLAKTERMTVVDDYAHHPTAVRETILAARSYHHGPVVVAFQPHRYTRTAYLANDFARSLQNADCTYLTPIYGAAETPVKGVSERAIGEPMRALGALVHYVDAVEDLPRRLLREAPAGALVLMLGAGSISLAAAQLAAGLRREAVLS